MVGARPPRESSHLGASSLLAASSLALLASCATSPAPPAAEGVRRPDGVSLDPPPALPEVATRARSSEGAATLQTPLGTDAALDLLDAYVRAIVAEDVVAMNDLHTGDSAFVFSPAGQVPRSFPNAPGLWERRFARFDYGALAGSIVLRSAEAKVRRLEAGAQGPAIATSEDGPSTPFGDAEVVVSAPLATSRVAGQSLLGTEIAIYLRREGERYRVSAVVEDFSMP